MTSHGGPLPHPFDVVEHYPSILEVPFGLHSLHQVHPTSSFIHSFILVCIWFVGTMLNDDILKQFFIHEFFKLVIIRGVFQRNSQILTDAKRAAREMKNLDRDHERLWRREDDWIPQFTPIWPRVMAGEPVKYKSQVPYALVDTGPRPLAVKEPTPFLGLPALIVDPHLKEVERSLGASKLGFQ